MPCMHPRFGLDTSRVFLTLHSRCGLPSQDATNISLLEFVEAAPVVVPPDMPLAYLYEVVQNLGLNFVPVVQRHGPMEGIVSR